MRKNKWLLEKKKADSRVHWMQKNGLKHWASTISPAPKMGNDIESVEAALQYYSNFTDRVILQPKFMGSYICAYLTKTDAKFFSRKGYLINHIDLNALRQASQIIYDRFDFDEIVVEGELMPWAALGSGLIEQEYRNYYTLHKDRLNYLPEIREKVEKVVKTKEYQDFLTDYTKELFAKDKSCKAKYPQHIYRQYSSIAHLNLDDYHTSLDLYKRQLDLFGKSCDISIEFFNIVSINGQVQDTNASFFGVNNHRAITLSTNAVDKAVEFFNEISAQELEGIVVKPINSRIKDCPRALKVRTKNYLQLIYGVNFDRDYEYYYNRRDIHKKLGACIKETNIHLELSAGNTDPSLYYAAINSEKFVSQLDSRL